MATRTHSSTTHAASAWFALLAAVVTTLCAPSAVRADEKARSAGATLTVAATVLTRCNVSTASTTSGVEGAAADGVALKCSAGVAPRTTSAYETVVAASEPSDDRTFLVTTVMF